MMFLPTELHDLILQHVPKADLSTYRLICRDFAEHGAQWMFKEIQFTASLKDLKRVSDVSKSNFGRCVKTLIWNKTSALGVDGRYRLESEEEIKGIRTRELRNLLAKSATNQPQRSQSLENVISEEMMRSVDNIGVFIFQAILPGMPNLKKLHVDSGWGSGRYEMQTLLVAAALSGHPLEKLKMQALHWMPARTPPFLEHAMVSLTSLRLSHLTSLVTSTTEQLRSCISSATNLRTLEISMDNHRWIGVGFGLTPSKARLQDLISKSDNFPHLRKVIFGYCHVSEEFLTSFLRSHGNTLRVLKMHSMRLDPIGSWPQIFRDARPFLSLNEADFDRAFDSDVSAGCEYWDMKSFGKELARYLLHERADCPIHAGNAALNLWTY